jgi:hypothetical protein
LPFEISRVNIKTMIRVEDIRALTAAAQAKNAAADDALRAAIYKSICAEIERAATQGHDRVDIQISSDSAPSNSFMYLAPPRARMRAIARAIVAELTAGQFAVEIKTAKYPFVLAISWEAK